MSDTEPAYGTPRRGTRLRGMELTEYRDRFPILEHTTYLINHSLGAMPAAAEERMLEFARMWKERGIRAWGEGWWEMPMTVGDQIGRIIGAPPGSTVMHQNVAIAEAIVVSCFRPVDPHRNRVVYEEGNFPSVRYLYQAQPELDVVVVAGRPGDRRGDRRAHAARPDHARPLQDRRRSRTSPRSFAVRTRSARTSSSTPTSRPGSFRSTSPR